MGINGIGRPPSNGGRNGGRITRGFFPMRQIERDGYQDRIYRDLMKQVNRDHGGYDLVKLYEIHSTDELKDFIGEELRCLLSPDLISFVKVAQETPFAKLRDLALKEIRSIYIPGRTTDRIYVSGQPGKELLLSIFEASPQQFNINPQSLPREYQSVVVVPLVSYLGKEQPLENYPRHGAIILAKSTPEGFDPAVHLPILVIIAEGMTAAMVENKLAF